MAPRREGRANENETHSEGGPDANDSHSQHGRAK